MVSKITLPKIKFDRPPEEWGPELYKALEAVFRDRNEQIAPFMTDMEDNVKQNTDSINKMSDLLK